MMQKMGWPPSASAQAKRCGVQRRRRQADVAEDGLATVGLLDGAPGVLLPVPPSSLQPFLSGEKVAGFLVVFFVVVLAFLMSSTFLFFLSSSLFLVVVVIIIILAFLSSSFFFFVFVIFVFCHRRRLLVFFVVVVLFSWSSLS